MQINYDHVWCTPLTYINTLLAFLVFCARVLHTVCTWTWTGPPGPGFSWFMKLRALGPGAGPARFRRACLRSFHESFVHGSAGIRSRTTCIIRCFWTTAIVIFIFDLLLISLLSDRNPTEIFSLILISLLSYSHLNSHKCKCEFHAFLTWYRLPSPDLLRWICSV